MSGQSVADCRHVRRNARPCGRASGQRCNASQPDWAQTKENRAAGAYQPRRPGHATKPNTSHLSSPMVSAVHPSSSVNWMVSPSLKT